MKNTEIEKLLHHRAPYLMVSEVLEISDNMIRTQKIHDGNEAHIKGHFPGTPVIPGAMLQEICTQSAGILLTKYHSPVANYNSEITKGYALGVLNKVSSAKFLKIVKPTSPVIAEVYLVSNIDNLFKFKARVKQNDELVAKLSFNLMNISDEYLM